MRGQLPTQPFDESKDSFIRFPEDTRVMAHETPLRITVGYVQWEKKKINNVRSQEQETFDFVQNFLFLLTSETTQCVKRL